MSSADSPPFSEQSDTTDAFETTKAKAGGPPAEDLAAFSVLADPVKIAGDETPAEPDQQAVVARLRAELQRRAQQVERMSRDLSVSQARAQARGDAKSTEEDPGWKPIAAPGSTAGEAGLERLLHAARRARHEMQERVKAREGELDELRREKNELAAALERAREELETTAGERERVSDLMSNLTTRSAAYERLSDECNTLRRTLVEAQREAAEARKASERGREVLAETRNRVAEREAEASALRAALATNQQQARARDCDNEELKAALSIASETLEARRAELRQARAELDATSRRLSESEMKAGRLENELQAQHERTSQQVDELAKLKEAVPRLEGELRERRSEAETLRERLTAQQSELVDAREALSQSRRKCEGLTDELENEREAHRRARERAAEREATMNRLHETLASIGKAASVFPLTEFSSEAVSEATAAVEARAVDPPKDEPETSAVQEDSVQESVEAVEDASPQPPDEPTAPNIEAAVIEAPVEVKPEDGEALLRFVTPSRGPERPPIFTAWRDQQIARKLAPLDMTDSDAYFARHIEAARSLAKDGDIEVLSLGGEEPDFELRVARALRKQGRSGFRIYFPQRDASHASRTLARAASAGIDSELVPFDASGWTEAGLPEHFHAIIGDGALSRSTQPEPYIEALDRATRSGSQVAIAERIGRGESRNAREMGDRVWRLMPERYKQNHITGEVDDAYAAPASAGHVVDILTGLRSHFAFEDFASFGHLVDRFIGPEIGPNFDPEDERDRRFIDQIANLDEAKLDSGALRPLHMIARLSPREPEA